MLKLIKNSGKIYKIIRKQRCFYTKFNYDKPYVYVCVLYIRDSRECVSGILEKLIYYFTMLMIREFAGCTLAWLIVDHGWA